MIGWLYDLGTRRAERGELGERRRRLLGRLEGDVLEIGAGTGASLPHYGRARRIVALEPDPGMAQRLPRRMTEASVPVELVDGRAESLPFENASFDAVVATFVLCSVTDLRAALAQIGRVLRPGGRLVLIEHVRGEGRIARWQDRLTPLHRRVAGNCHLNRETQAAVRAAGFDTAGIESTTAPAAHLLAKPAIQGVAIKTSS